MEEKVEKLVEVAKEVLGEKKADAARADATTLTFNVYLMYKLNMLTRIQVRDYLQLVKEGRHPDDILAYLQEEVKKLG